MTPLVNLIWFVVVVLLIALLLWPHTGLLARLARRGRTAFRVVVEDALKHIYDGEFRGRPATLESLSGILQINRSKAVELVERMQTAGLVRHTDHQFTLTEAGKRYALEVIRAHRLWERYLADETGVDPLKWHASAERREHKMTREEANELAVRLGNPRYDPHGDPIPTADGVVPEEDIVALSTLEVGDVASVVHMEDEPDVVYAQLVALGIYLGMELRVEARSEERMILEADGRELVLASLLADNVSIQLASTESVEEAASYKTLSELRQGQRARVVRISPACHGPERRRLMDLGIVPGTLMRFERRGPSGGSIAYVVRGTLIALREEQADLIAITIENEAAA
jgi:DtxR family Mn-dependent transcriptional regulator